MVASPEPSPRTDWSTPANREWYDRYQASLDRVMAAWLRDRR
jgi:hypothetical protein